MKKIFLFILFYVLTTFFVSAGDSIQNVRYESFKYQFINYNQLDKIVITKNDYIVSGVAIGVVAIVNIVYFSHHYVWTDSSKNARIQSNGINGIIALDVMLVLTQVCFYLLKEK